MNKTEKKIVEKFMTRVVLWIAAIGAFVMAFMACIIAAHNYDEVKKLKEELHQVRKCVLKIAEEQKEPGTIEAIKAFLGR